MNFGILMVQGLVNSFGAVVMAAFAVAVKIDTIAYMPVQDFGNAFSVFVAQNFGAGKKDRIRAGMKSAGISVAVFCAVISTAVCVFAKTLMQIFVSGSDEVVRTGVQYLRIEGMFYIGIGILFMLYGYYRAVSCPGVSVVLTVISLGTRVMLAYTLSAVSWIGVAGIWGSIPIGWFLADFAVKKKPDIEKIAGYSIMKSKNKRISCKAAETGVFYVKGLEQIGTTVKRGNGTAFKEGACALRTAADSDEGKETAGAGAVRRLGCGRQG
jgi:hypothetical protein